MNKSSKVVIIQSPVVHSDRDYKVTVMCSDGLIRTCELDKMSFDEQNYMIHTLRDAFFDAARVTFHPVGVNVWKNNEIIITGVDVEPVDGFHNNKVRICWHSDDVHDWEAKIYRSAIAFACKEWNLSKYNFRMVMTFDSKVHLKPKDCLGTCMLTKRPVNFRLSIATECKVVDEQIDTIFHEMRHAHQYLSGVLKTNNMWKGKDYSKTSYKDRPWEIDARNTAKNMVKKFKALKLHY